MSKWFITVGQVKLGFKIKMQKKYDIKDQDHLSYFFENILRGFEDAADFTVLLKSNPK